MSYKDTTPTEILGTYIYKTFLDSFERYINWKDDDRTCNSAVFSKLDIYSYLATQIIISALGISASTLFDPANTSMYDNFRLESRQMYYSISKELNQLKNVDSVVGSTDFATPVRDNINFMETLQNEINNGLKYMGFVGSCLTVMDDDKWRRSGKAFDEMGHPMKKVNGKNLGTAMNSAASSTTGIVFYITLDGKLHHENSVIRMIKYLTGTTDAVSAKRKIKSWERNEVPSGTSVDFTGVSWVILLDRGYSFPNVIEFLQLCGITFFGILRKNRSHFCNAFTFGEKADPKDKLQMYVPEKGLLQTEYATKVYTKTSSFP